MNRTIQEGRTQWNEELGRARNIIVYIRQLFKSSSGMVKKVSRFGVVAFEDSMIHSMTLNILFYII